MEIQELRRNYTFGSLVRDQLPPLPMPLFRDWFAQLQNAQRPDWFEVNAMNLATALPGGGVSSRIVLLKHLDEDGFVFFTNYESHKGHELAIEPKAALHFYWPLFDRQVRVEGIVSKSDAVVSDEYFQSRPRSSQIGALVSPQSQVIESEAKLALAFEQAEQIYQDKLIPRPDNWGGYKLVPDMMEFWQGKPSRLHDRFRYSQNKTNLEWTISRLAP